MGEEVNTEEEKPSQRRKRMLASAEAYLQSTREIANAIEQEKEEIKRLATAVAEKCRHIDEGHAYVVRTREQAEAELNKTSAFATSASKEVERAKADLDSLDDLVEAAQEKSGQIVTTAAAIKESLSQSQAYEKSAGDIQHALELMQDKIKGYEAALQKFNADAKVTFKLIENLLPAATTAGLASSYGSRRTWLSKTGRNWQAATIISLVFLAGIACYDLGFHAQNGAESLQEINWIATIRHAIAYSPMIWLVLYCSRQASSSKRLEEEYAFKEAISRSFEGYKQQLRDLEDAVPADAPIKQLCRDTLTILATPPARVYDKHRLDVSPLTAFADSAPRLADFFQRSADLWKMFPTRKAD